MPRHRKFAALFAVGLGALTGCSDEAGTSTVTPPTSTPPEPSRTPVREVKGGQVHQGGQVAPIDARGAAPAEMLPAFENELRHAVGTLDPSDFTLEAQRAERTPGRSTLNHVSYRQVHGGVPIQGAYLHLTLREDGLGGSKLVASSHHLYQNPEVDTRDQVGEARAGTLARMALRAGEDARLIKAEKALRPIDGALQLVWDINVAGHHERATVIANGARTGRLILVDDRVFDIPGSVSGFTVSNGAPGAPGGTAAPTPLPFAQVSGGSAVVSADAAGNFSINVTAGTAIQARLIGRASVVQNQSGANVVAGGAATAGVNLMLSSAIGSEQALAQTTAYRFVDATRSFLEANGLAPDELGSPVPTYVNINDFCNAYYDPGAISVNFFSSGGGCNNSAINSVIAHEYGHFVDDHFGGIFDGGLSEGWGDTLACFFLKSPLVGAGLFSDGSAIRTCDNFYMYPPGGYDEVHNLGQAWAGFTWHARANLIAELGEDGGDALARALVLPSFPSNAADIPTAVREVFLRDDDDGDLGNQTPHWSALWASAELHGLTSALFADVTPPAQVTDLTATQIGTTTATIHFTAPGDDDVTGTATSYDIRWSLQPIDDSNFAAAQPMSAPAPLPGGAAQETVVSLPPGTTVHLALRATDDVGNISLVSNDLQITTQAGVAVFSESFEEGPGSFGFDGLWHVSSRRASDGTHAFWYGQEETGNYNTGSSNAGTLTSPVIDLTGVQGAVLVVDEFLDVEMDPYDRADIIVTDAEDGANSVTFPKTTGWTHGMFEPRVTSLAGFDGRRITVTFHFDTGDSVLNSTEGWYIDHVRILGENTSSTCEHPICDAGTPLDPTCDACAQTVCAADPYCCTGEWDRICVQSAQQTCGVECDATCAHDLCVPGGPLDHQCDPCTQQVCAQDPYCCSTSWDRTCVEEAANSCGLDCVSCSHDLCAAGGQLDAACDPCAQAVCAQDPYCCSNAWDARCVDQAAAACGLTCGCSHGVCDTGAALADGCDPCVAAVCAQDTYCCSGAWDDRCVEDANNVCGATCPVDVAAASRPRGRSGR